jgi:sporulation protein YlmC with PRC-barrel domain
MKFGLTTSAFAALALIGLVAAAQNQNGQDSLRSGENAVPAQPGDGPGQADSQDEGFYRASEILGSTVRGEGGEELGQIQDLLVDRRSQRITHFILDDQGDSQPVRSRTRREQPAPEANAQASVRVVPWSVVRTQYDGPQPIVTVPFAPQRFQQAPTHTWQEIQTGPRGGWVNDVNRFYGVRPGRFEVERDGDVEIKNRDGSEVELKPNGRVKIDND